MVMLKMGRPREFDEDCVLDAVMETFWQHGYEGTSTQNLVDATGLGRGSLYAAYSNKDGLFEQALRRYRLRSRANIERLEAFESPLAGIRDLMQRTIEEDISGGRRGCLVTNSAIEMAHRDPRIAALVAENFHIMAAGLRAAIENAQSAGEIPSHRDPEASALFLLTTIQGLRVIGRTTPPDRREMLFTVVEQALTSLH